MARTSGRARTNGLDVPSAKNGTGFKKWNWVPKIELTMPSETCRPAESRHGLKSLLAKRLDFNYDAAEILIRNTPEEQRSLAWQEIFH